ncbi:phospholipase D family protein [Methyloprofundus sp.]|uniref:phospholipase D family protein n=1 Tax=Methyloprofundus sp. TaxID=2020875 RepID=UPI003D0F78F2
MTRTLRIISLLVLTLLVGCATIDKEIVRIPSYALEGPELTSASQFIQADLDQHPGKSGFVLLDSGERAFTSRNAMTQIAEKTIDVQYYIWEDDITGAILINQLIKAAERGVRVRLLIDDVNSGGRDFGMTKLDTLANFEVRLFNPFENRSFQAFEFISDMSRLNHRMHNKSFIMDNTFAIIGGRNIGNKYFGVNADINFRDLDVLAAGPIVKDISHSFDVFWNSEWAIPIKALNKKQPSGQEIYQSLERLHKYIENHKDFPYPIHRAQDEIYQRMNASKSNLIWADAEILYDDPVQKIDTGTGYQGIIPHLRQWVDETQDEILIESAYYIAGPGGAKRVRELRDKGIKIRVLTNSMATNDVAAAYVFYAKYREGLIENGVELYELRPDMNAQRKFWSLLASKSSASLHTKVIVFDRKKTFIGSFNLDPRSVDINTEIGLLIDSAELAEQVVAYMDVGTKSSDSYRLILEKEDQEDEGKLVWISEQDGKEVREYSNPKSGFWRPVTAWFISLLPIEDQM